MWKRLALAISSVLVAGGLVVTPVLTAPASAAEQVGDGGFELGVASGSGGLDSPSWTEADSLFGSPLCRIAGCDGGPLPPAGARTGNAWAWFGGNATAGHTASISQAVTIPAGTPALTYWYRNGSVSSPYNATLVVRIDGTIVNVHTEASTPEPAYSLQTVSLGPAYANGGLHTLSFSYTNGTTGLNSMDVDDVSILTGTATPTLTSVAPTSPASSTTPSVTGTAEAGSTVTLYANSACTGPALGTGTAAAFGSAGIQATVPPDAMTTIHAKAAKPTQADSACSSTSVSYTNDSTAPAAPTGLSVTPASPHTSTAPSVRGTAEAGSTVQVYAGTGCTGAPVATGTAAGFGGVGLPVTVGVGSTTTFHATATDGVGNTSGCSTSSATYTHDNPLTQPPAPDTTLDKTPKRTVRTAKRKAKVSFAFSSPKDGAGFQCSIDGQAFMPCTSGISFKARLGKHTFAVRAVVGGVIDPAPATYAFKVRRKHRR